jgi:pyruvate-formate lyase
LIALKVNALQKVEGMQSIYYLPQYMFQWVLCVEGVSPVQGADHRGPTAVINSVAKIDHTRVYGTLLNQKFHPSILKGDDNLKKFAKYIRSYFSMMGHHIQFNVISIDTLKKAQKDPQKYQDLIVRVAGYSDYFINLNSDLQNEIITRTEQVEIG